MVINQSHFNEHNSQGPSWFRTQPSSGWVGLLQLHLQREPDRSLGFDTIITPYASTVCCILLNRSSVDCQLCSPLVWSQAEHGWHTSCNGHHPMLRMSTDRLNIAGICLVIVILPCSAWTSAVRQEPSWFQCSALPGQLFHPRKIRNATFHRTHYHVSCFNLEHLEMICFIEHITWIPGQLCTPTNNRGFIEHINTKFSFSIHYHTQNLQVICFNPLSSAKR